MQPPYQIGPPEFGKWYIVHKRIARRKDASGVSETHPVSPRDLRFRGPCDSEYEVGELMKDFRAEYPSIEVDVWQCDRASARNEGVGPDDEPRYYRCVSGDVDYAALEDDCFVVTDHKGVRWLCSETTRDKMADPDAEDSVGGVLSMARKAAAQGFPSDWRVQMNFCRRSELPERLSS